MEKITKLVDNGPCDPFESSVARVARCLSRDFGFEGLDALRTAEDIRQLSPVLRTSFRQYWGTKACNSDLRFETFPYSLGEIIKYLHVHPIEAFVLLSGVIMDPQGKGAKRFVTLLNAYRARGGKARDIHIRFIEDANASTRSRI